MPPIVALADAQAYLGTPSDPAAKITRLLDAISVKIRRITRRALEGAGTVYDEVYRVDGARFVTLPNVPLDAVLGIRRTYFDGTEEPIFEPVVVDGGASTTLAADAARGAINLKVAAITGIAVGDKLLIGSSLVAAGEIVRVTVVGTAGAGGTGLSIEPATRYAHVSGDAGVEVDGSPTWRVDSAARGRIELRPTTGSWQADIGILARYLRITYRATGAIPADLVQACLDWLKDAWENDVDNPAAGQELASQSSDSWSESYAVPLPNDATRKPPPDVVRALAGYYHATGGGPI